MRQGNRKIWFVFEEAGFLGDDACTGLVHNNGFMGWILSLEKISA
jgi:hypothetical protein